MKLPYLAGGAMMDVKDIIESTKYLSAKERALIARCMISSLETRQDNGVDPAWSELAQKRFTELISGNTRPVSARKSRGTYKGKTCRT